MSAPTPTRTHATWTPKDNPAVEDALPDEMKQMEDTSTEATEDDEGEADTEHQEESPA